MKNPGYGPAQHEIQDPPLAQLKIKPPILLPPAGLIRLPISISAIISFWQDIKKSIFNLLCCRRCRVPASFPGAFAQWPGQAVRGNTKQTYLSDFTMSISKAAWARH